MYRDIHLASFRRTPPERFIPSDGQLAFRGCPRSHSPKRMKTITNSFRTRLLSIAYPCSMDMPATIIDHHRQRACVYTRMNEGVWVRKSVLPVSLAGLMSCHRVSSLCSTSTFVRTHVRDCFPRRLLHEMWVDW